MTFSNMYTLSKLESQLCPFTILTSQPGMHDYLEQRRELDEHIPQTLCSFATKRMPRFSTHPCRWEANQSDANRGIIRRGGAL